MSKLAVHTRLHLRSSGEMRVIPFVRCPTDGRWASLEACRVCRDATRVEGTGGDALVLCAKRRAPEVDPARAPIADAMDTAVLTVAQDSSIDDVARELEARDLAVAVIVDQAAHPIGVCSRTDVARAQPGSRVDAVMTPFVIMLLSNATVADAVDLLLSRDLHHVPVLAAGRIVGVVSATAALRWFAQNMRAARSRRAPRATTP